MEFCYEDEDGEGEGYDLEQTLWLEEYGEDAEWSWYTCVCDEECYWDEDFEAYWPIGCGEDFYGETTCENAAELWGAFGCPYRGYCECDSDCKFNYDMEYDDCGCDPLVGEFCAYNWGSSGRCTNCFRYSTIEDCSADDEATEAAVAACEKVCFNTYPNDANGGCYYLEDYGDVCHYMEFDGTCPEEEDACDELYGNPEFCEEGANWFSAGVAITAMAALGISMI